MVHQLRRLLHLLVVILSISWAIAATDRRVTTCICGTPITTSRIVGGEEIKVHQYPWLVALTSPSGDQFCGGSLINDLYILTTAHCLYRSKPSSVRVRLREHDLGDRNDTKLVIRSAEELIIHPNYNQQTLNNDIALIKMQKPVKIGENIIPVCLPSQTTNSYAGETATVTGWGNTVIDGFPVKPREVDVPVLSHKQCKFNTNYLPSEITRKMLCAGEEGKDSCQADSGGPLMFMDPFNRYDVIGVVSWGIGCALEGFPGVYARVNRFLPFIEKNTVNGTYCKGAFFP